VYIKLSITFVEHVVREKSDEENRGSGVGARYLPKKGSRESPGEGGCRKGCKGGKLALRRNIRKNEY